MGVIVGCVFTCLYVVVCMHLFIANDCANLSCSEIDVSFSFAIFEGVRTGERGSPRYSSCISISH